MFYATGNYLWFAIHFFFYFEIVRFGDVAGKDLLRFVNKTARGLFACEMSKALFDRLEVFFIFLFRHISKSHII